MAITKSAGYGMGLFNMIASQVPAFGRVFVVVNSTDVANPNYQELQDLMTPDNFGVVRFFTSLADAYAATTTNNNDVILLDSKTSHKVTSMLTISKSRIHFFGMGGANRKIGARTLVSNTGTGAATDTAMILNTGTGNTFHNIAFKNNWTVTENLYAVHDMGSNTYMENCDIESLGSAHLTNAAAASLAMTSAIECIYENCTIGQNTLLVTSTAGQQLLMVGAATKSARCRFENCRFQTRTSDATHALVRAAATSIDRDLMLRNCEFVTERYATGATATDVAVVGTSGFGGTINLYNPAAFGSAKLSVSTGVFTISPVVAGSTTVVSAQTS